MRKFLLSLLFVSSAWAQTTQPTTQPGPRISDMTNESLLQSNVFSPVYEEGAFVIIQDGSNSTNYVVKQGKLVLLNPASHPAP